MAVKTERDSTPGKVPIGLQRPVPLGIAEAGCLQDKCTFCHQPNCGSTGEVKD